MKWERRALACKLCDVYFAPVVFILRTLITAKDPNVLSIDIPDETYVTLVW
jgi:hypothetical protein